MMTPSAAAAAASGGLPWETGGATGSCKSLPFTELEADVELARRRLLWRSVPQLQRQQQRHQRGDRLQLLAEHMSAARPRQRASSTIRTAPITASSSSPGAMASAATASAVSAGATVFEPAPEHFKLPHGFFMREATSVAVDSRDNVFVFNRGNIPVLVFDDAGNLIDHWGNDTPYEGTEEVHNESFALFGPSFVLSRWLGSQFMRPHAIFIDHADDDRLWLVDDLANTITKCDRHGNREMILAPEGRVLRDQGCINDALGKVIACPPSQSGRMFNRPTDVVTDPTSGEIYIADGYGNSHVHRLLRDGSHVASFGGSGTDAGQFNCPHNLAIADGRLLVCDRENMRVQVYSLRKESGGGNELVGSWHMHRPVAICRGLGRDMDSVYVAELGSDVSFQRGAGPRQLDTFVPNLGHRIVVYDGRATAPFSPVTLTPPVLATLGGGLPGERPQQFSYLHSLATDSRGAVYAAEVSFINIGAHQSPPREVVSLRKWVRA
jgi:DNA-binding beta-propeller fold protein YncE